MSSDRFVRTVQRIAAEAFWLKTYQAAINGLRVEAIGLDLFRVSPNALKDARLIRLIRILEDSSRTASFWYLLRTNQNLVETTAKQAGLDLDELRQVSLKLRGIRDKTFVHIDKEGFFDPQVYYTEAGLNNDHVTEIIDHLWGTMQHMHVAVVGHDVEGDHYSGQDIRKLAELRDKAT